MTPIVHCDRCSNLQVTNDRGKNCSHNRVNLKFPLYFQVIESQVTCFWALGVSIEWNISQNWELGKCPRLRCRQNPCLPALRKITTTLFFSQYCKFMCTILYYYDQSFMSPSHPKKKYFFFIHLKSKENFSAISEKDIFKIVNN